MAIMGTLTELAAALPRTVDQQQSTGRIALFLTLLLLVLLFPTGLLTANEEYYFQVAARLASGAPSDSLSAVQETSYHLFLSSLIIGLPVEWWGFETANAVLRIVTALALAVGFARLASAWRLSALDAVVAVSAFVLLDQQYFGGEWIFYSVEGKVFAYVLVFVGLASATSGRWKPCVAAMALATWFHFLVGGFWALIAFAWLLLEGQRPATVIRAAALWLAAILPLAALILWQRSESGLPGASTDTWHAYAVLRMPHHIAPFSETTTIWNWTPRIVLLAGTLIASVIALGWRADAKAGRLIKLLIGLQAYLLVVLLVSASDAGVRILGQFYPFRPSSLTLLLVVVAGLILVRQGSGSRLPVWMAAWVLVPLAAWGAVKDKVQEVLARSLEPAALTAMVDAVRGAAAESQVVLIQPGRDDEHPEVTLSRRLPRPTLVNWQFTPTDDSGIAEWLKRQRFRIDLFSDGCRGGKEYPVGALVVFLPDAPADEVLASCGDMVWRGGRYGVVDVR